MAWQQVTQGLGTTLRRRNLAVVSMGTRKRCSPGTVLVSVTGCQLAEVPSVALHSAP
jgi:hypothetical protein